MRNFAIWSGLALVGLVAVLVFVVDGLFDVVEEEKAEKSEIVGENVVIGRDTLVVVDYKFLVEKYVLSNGVEISEDYATSLIEK